MKTSIVLTLSIVAALLIIIGALVFLKPNDEVELPVRLEEYFDYNCGHCKTFFETGIKLEEKFGEDLEFELIHNPILGDSSQQAAFAAEAAREQDKFIEYSQKLFDNFDKRSDQDFQDFAKELELDLEKFNQDREDPDIQKRVLLDRQSAEKKGLNATPVIYLDGRRVVNRSYENMVKEIEEKIKKAKNS